MYKNKVILSTLTIFSATLSFDAAAMAHENRPKTAPNRTSKNQAIIGLAVTMHKKPIKQAASTSSGTKNRPTTSTMDKTSPRNTVTTNSIKAFAECMLPARPKNPFTKNFDDIDEKKLEECFAELNLTQNGLSKKDKEKHDIPKLDLSPSRLAQHAMVRQKAYPESDSDLSE